LQEITNKLGLIDRVKFFPDVSRPEMKQLLKNAKIYLHTMIGEHFGISIVEAMAMACIPIVHDSGGAKEFVPKIFRYRTIHEAAAKITKEIYEWSPQKAIKMVKIAEKFKEENFSNEFMKLFERYAGSIL
jgi:alpha-1,2-mannosyltransferase